MKALLASVLVLTGLFFWLGANVERFVNRIDDNVLPGVSEQALHLHDASLVVDLHADSLLFDRDLLLRSEVGHVDLPRLQAGGVALQMFTAPTRVPFGFDIHHMPADGIDLLTLAWAARLSPRAGMGPRARALDQAAALRGFCERSDGLLAPVRSRADLDSVLVAHRANPLVVGALFGLEGAQALEGDLANLEPLFEAGVRMIGITHFFDNEFAGSAHGIEKGGLTPLGRDLVTRMEELGIAVDLAHLSPAAVDDVLDMATKPVLVSHGGVRGTCDNPRNLSDEHLRRIAANGGVVGIGYFELAVCGNESADVVAAIAHAVAVMGDEHVALGSDYDGAVSVSFDTSMLRALTQQMLDDGLAPEAIRKILGANAIRVLRATLPRR